MPRNMSFMLTTEQIANRTKTVTRRLGWSRLQPGDIIWACKKCMGIKKGETIEKIAMIRIVSTTTESLSAIDRDDCIREGFANYSPEDFVSMFLDAHPSHKIIMGTQCMTVRKARNDGKSDMTIAHYVYVNRIEFEYLDITMV